jgi:bifunctional non-homologous end joining protein LigD
VTHIDALNDAIAAHRADRLAYFAFDLLHLDGRDLRRCPIEERKATLRRVIDDVGCERIVYVDHVMGRGKQLFEKVREMGGEGVVSKRLGRPYRGGESRDWLKSKVFEIGRFAITGFQELGEGRLEAIHVAKEHDGAYIRRARCGSASPAAGLWGELDGRRMASRL